MVLIEFKKIIEFEFLNPEGMIKLWKPDFKLNEWVTGVKSDIVNPDKNNSIMNNLIVYIGAGAAAVVILVSLFILSYICRKRVKKQFDKIKKKLFFTGIVRSITISYVTVCLTVGKQVQLAIENSEFQKPNEQYVSLAIGVFCVLIPLVIIIFLRNNYSELDSPEMRAKYGSLYKMAPLNRDYYMVFVYPTFLIHRLIYVLIPSTLFAVPAF